MLGKALRTQRVLGTLAPTIMVALDDTLISGPIGMAAKPAELAQAAAVGGANSILAFPGVMEHVLSPNIGRIVNLTGSTTIGAHTRKVPVCTVEKALRHGADAVAVHINVSSEHEPEMLMTAGRVADEVDKLGLPLLVLAYPRRTRADGTDDNYHELRRENPSAYTTLLGHCVRVAVDLGASIIKTQYSGDAQSMRQVVASADDVPVLVAGGPASPVEQCYSQAKAAMEAGARGVSLGRNFFTRKAPGQFLTALREQLDLASNIRR